MSFFSVFTTGVNFRNKMSTFVTKPLNKTNRMKNSITILFFTVILLQGVVSNAQQDTTLFYQVEGNIVDSKTRDPVIYADIIFLGTNKGTVANIDGGFTLKIPVKKTGDSLIISSIGYKSKIINVASLQKKDNIIKLIPVTIQLSEVSIRSSDARSILISAIKNIRDNYRTDPYMVTAFYRESIKRRRKYVAVSEAVLDAYNAAYTNPFDRDRLIIVKARKSSDFQKKDTLALKLQGGPFIMFQLDFVKKPGNLLQSDILEYYNYTLSGQVIIDNKLAYVISFEQFPGVSVPLYKGKFYIDVENLAFLGAEFQVNEERISKAAEYMVKKKPPGVIVNIEKAYYKVNYRFFKGKWYLSYVRTRLVLFMKWKKKHFRSRYSMVAEMAVTDMDTVNITKYKRENTLNYKDVFIEKVGNFEDPGFWGEYNIIYPEEPIQSAIKRMGRKLRRKNK